MYNLRYHIASLVAVFLALSVGLVLGSIVVERGTIERQQDALVKSLQTDFVRINGDNRRLNADLEASDEFAAALVPEITSGLLADKNVLVLTNSGRTDGLASVVDAIERADGTAAIMMLEAPGLDLSEERVASAANAVLGTLDGGDDLARSVVTSLAVEWAGTGPRPLTEALVDAGAMRAEGFSGTRPVDGVVVMAAWDGEVDPITLDLAAALRDRDIRVVGAEARTASTGVANAFASDGFDAVNDLGTARGEYSLSVLLAELAEGYYGAGPSPDGPFPPVPADTGD